MSNNPYNFIDPAGLCKEDVNGNGWGHCNGSGDFMPPSGIGVDAPVSEQKEQGRGWWAQTKAFVKGSDKIGQSLLKENKQDHLIKMSLKPIGQSPPKENKQDHLIKTS